MAKLDRGLTPDDAAIWRRVAKTVRPAPDKVIPEGQDAMEVAMSPRRAGRPASMPAPLARPRPYMPPSPKALDRAMDRKTRRGKIVVDMKLDLHDMTQDEALGALVSGLHRARSRNARCVLVVTGKGSISHGGVLRRRLPEWLARADIRPMVSRYAQAHIRHGGAGAYYVYLKAAAPRS